MLIISRGMLDKQQKHFCSPHEPDIDECRDITNGDALLNCRLVGRFDKHALRYPLSQVRILPLSRRNDSVAEWFFPINMLIGSYGVPAAYMLWVHVDRVQFPVVPFYLLLPLINGKNQQRCSNYLFSTICLFLSCVGKRPIHERSKQRSFFRRRICFS